MLQQFELRQSPVTIAGIDEECAKSKLGKTESEPVHEKNLNEWDYKVSNDLVKD